MTCFVLTLAPKTNTWHVVAACSSLTKANAVASQLRKQWHQVKVTSINTVKTEHKAVAA